MLRKKLIIVGVIVICLVGLCGCAKKCASCDNEIAEGAEIEIDGSYYCEDCVEYCTKCDAPFLKGDKSMLVYEGKRYCKDCFDKIAYPIVLEDNDNISLEITGYDDKEGLFTVKATNKTDYPVSFYQEGESALMDGKTKCIPETDGSYSFAYVDVPANDDATVFCSFRQDDDKNWETKYKMSDGHSFEFIMCAYVDDDDNFWDTNFKVELTPEMFGYAQ